MLWYVIQVKTGEEQKIASQLRENGLQALVPVENRPIHAGGVWSRKEYVLFSGYVFLRMHYNAQNYYMLKKIPGVIKLLKGTLTYLEAEWIKLLSGKDGVPLEPTLVRNAEEGLEIVDGILENFKSRITKFDKRSRRATFELTLCGEKKEVQLGIRLPDEEEQEASG